MSLLFRKRKEWAEFYFIQHGICTMLSRSTVRAEGKFGETKLKSSVRGLLSAFAKVVLDMDQNESAVEYITSSKSSFDQKFNSPSSLLQQLGARNSAIQSLTTLFSAWSLQRCASELAKSASLRVEIEHEKLRRGNDLFTAYFKVMSNYEHNEEEHRNVIFQLKRIRSSVNPERLHLIYCTCNVTRLTGIPCRHIHAASNHLAACVLYMLNPETRSQYQPSDSTILRSCTGI